MLARIARLAIAAPKRIVAGAGLLLVAAAIFAQPVAKSLGAGGFIDPASEAVQAAEMLSAKFDHNDARLLIAITADDGVRGAAASAMAADITAILKSDPGVANVTSLWSASATAAPALTSRDGKTGMIIAGIRGTNDEQFVSVSERVADRLPADRDGVTVRVGGTLTYAQINAQSERDLVTMESIAIPVSFIALVWIFGGVFAAALPMAVGVFAIVASLAALRVVTFFADVSVFTLNIIAALGLALAVDYTLLIVSRFRDEMANGMGRDEAVVRTMTTAGRTVAFSAATVALSLGAMVVFPMYFLRSFAYAGVAVVSFAALAAIVVTPAVIVLLGARIDAWDVRKLARRALGRPPAPAVRPPNQRFWYRTTHAVMRRAGVVAVVLIAVLLLLGSPFLGVRWGFPDDRVLPTTATARQVGDLLRTEFPVDPISNLSVVVPDMAGVSAEALNGYAADLSRLPDVAGVSTPAGTFVAGTLAGPPSAPTGVAHGSAFVTVQSTAPLYSDASNEQLRALHGVAGPAGHSILIGGASQFNRDSVASIMSKLPLVLGIIAIITFAVLFLATGSVVLPLKAVVLNILSLTATFGALVWIFQDGHLGGLGTATTGTLAANVPVLMFCVAFGLSMDYEVFVLSRIREYWLASGGTRADNDESVALGVAGSGRVVTAAALLMAISFSALTTAEVSFMRMFGLGLTIAVLVDATVVRTLLLPALMRVLGRANWWAPAPLARLHRRAGFIDGGAQPATTVADPLGDTLGREPILG